MYKFVLALILTAMFGWLQSRAEEKTGPEQKNANTENFKMSYFTPSVSFNIMNFTDFATSPLSYLGGGFNGGVGWLWDRKKSEHVLDFDFIMSTALANVPQSNYFQTSASSNVMGLTVYDHFLVQVFKPSLPGFINLKVGGALMSTTYIRSNSVLSNSNTGVESILNLMAVAKGTFDISRKSPITLDLFLFKKTLKPVKRNISFQFNAGLLNMNYRPGYIYNPGMGLNGTKTNIMEFILNKHSWSVNGCRFVTKLEYARYKPSGNGHKWAYIWDTAVVPGKFEQFQIATHRLQYTFIINCN